MKTFLAWLLCALAVGASAQEVGGLPQFWNGDTPTEATIDTNAPMVPTDYGQQPAPSVSGVPDFWNAVFGFYDVDGLGTYQNIAQIGAGANGTNDGAAFGYGAMGLNSGSAFGFNANGCDTGAALGAYANAAAGGAAVGIGTIGTEDGAAVGYYAMGYSYGVAIGASSQGYGLGNVSIGYNSISSTSPGADAFENTAEIGTGQATLYGGLHYRGNVICDGDGVLLVKSPGGGFFHLAVADDGTLYATNPITASGATWSTP